jgi:hypothetical protein
MRWRSGSGRQDRAGARRCASGVRRGVLAAGARASVLVGDGGLVCCSKRRAGQGRVGSCGGAGRSAARDFER